MSNDHFYCTDPGGELASIYGYEIETLESCRVLGTNQPGSTSLFRWLSPTTGDHFYTVDPNGELATQYGYKFEGVSCFVYSNPAPNTVPLFRWLNNASGDHFYTIDPQGEKASEYGYIYETIACHVFKNPVPGSVPFARWLHTGMMQNFTFSGEISEIQRLKVMQRHAFALYRTKTCGSLTSVEKAAVIAAYSKAIDHGISTNPNANAEAQIGGRYILINFNNLFPQGDREIAQTLLHEMMHNAGYSHPQKGPNDIPGDNGSYFTSPPLRAELCIDGVQSDAGLIGLQRFRFGISGKHLCCPVK
jgi:Repeat of unknown function (DUF5648)